MVIGRTDERQNPRGLTAIACRNFVWTLFAEPIWASGHGAASQGRTHDSIRTTARFCKSFLEPNGPFSNRVSAVNDLFARCCCLREVMVLYAVGVCRRNIWSEAQALQCPQRTRAERTRSNGLFRSQPAPSPRWATRTRASGPRERISLRFHQALTGCSDQRNASPDRHMLWRITESFLASATRAFPGPDRFAMACAQSFKGEARFTRVKITTAASYNNVRASVSPHRDILPLRSISPD